MKTVQHYLGNPLLKAARQPIEFTIEQAKEFAKCRRDPVYFAANYAKVVSLDDGPVLFKPYPYQKRFIKALHTGRKVVGKIFRQAGKSVTCAVYIAWYALFNDHKTACILANKASIAREIFSRVQFIIENLPFWLQQGVVEWNKTSFNLENGSTVFCAASSPSAVRGKSINLLMCDEFGHLAPKLAEEFIASVFPTISSSKESKLIIVSTPKGMNQFYKLWKDAEAGLNGFITVEGKWQEHPLRDQKWADEQLAILGKVKFAQEILCSFVGSSKNLIDGEKIAQIPFIQPEYEREGLKMYEAPQKGHMYICTVDVSRGQHLDHSAFIVYDVTKMPYNIVATFKNNEISTMVYPALIEKTCKQYNDAYALVEINDAGGDVANTLFYDLEYPNLYWTHKDDLVEGAGYPGVRTTKKVKSVGCSVLKELVEQDQLMINSYDIVVEMNNFVAKGASYAAEDTQINDDLMSCLWLFAWLTKQSLFAEVTNTNIRQVLSKKFEEQMRESMIPFGYITDGTDDHEPSTDLSSYAGMGGDPFKNWLLS